MDKIYEDFTTKLLPHIQSGLAVTKDYFIDLFGRYIKYLIVTDSIYAGISSLLFIVSVAILVKAGNLMRKEEYAPEAEQVFLFIIGIIATTITFCCIINYTVNIVKDFYIPEVRVYEELNPHINK